MEKGHISSRAAYTSIILLGFVSMMGDTVYEGARGLVPDYLYYLGASAFVVGVASGLGEFLGYVIRLGSGEAADRTRAYWSFIFLGYGLIVAIPLLGFAWTWEIAVVFVLLERLGKGLRAPSRDAVLSIVSKGVGAGRAFGLHELLDQVGAVVGPLLVAGLMFYTLNNYQVSFLFLFLPFLLLVLALGITRRKVGVVGVRRTEAVDQEHTKLRRPFYVYTFAVFLNTIGLIPAALILFRASVLLQPENLEWFVPIVFVIIQGADAVVAPVAGYAFDRYGVRLMAIPFILSIIPALYLSLAVSLEFIIYSAVFFGLVLGMQESTYRAAVVKFAPIQSRGRAYGIFNTAYGIGFLISGAMFGMFLDFNAPFITIFLSVVTLQALATAVLSATHIEEQGKAVPSSSESEP